MSVLIATESIVFRTDGGGEPRELFRRPGVPRIAPAGGGRVLAALADGSIRLFGNGEETVLVEGFDRAVRSLLVLRHRPLDVLVGTEPAHVHRLRAGGIEAVEAFDRLECRDAWHTPWGGPPAVRSLAAAPGGYVYADIHVGSIMRSDDDGEHWEPVAPDLNEDVHQVATCPSAPGRVYANTARAVYISSDRGLSWHHRSDDLGNRYGRAVAVAPHEPDLILATVSDGPHGDDVHGQLYRTEDAGTHWTHLAEGFPASTADNIDTCHVAFADDGTAWACVGKTLYVGRQRATTWETFWDAPEPIRMLA